MSAPHVDPVAALALASAAGVPVAVAGALVPAFQSGMSAGIHQKGGGK